MPHERTGTQYLQITVGGRRRGTRYKKHEWDACAQYEKDCNAASAPISASPVDNSKTKSWDDLMILWKKERSGKSTFGEDQAKLRWLYPHLGHIKDIGLIDRAMIDDIMQTYRPVQPKVRCQENATANRYTQLVSAMLNLAAKYHNWISKVPMLRRYPEVKKHNTVLSTLEAWHKLSAELPIHLRRPALFNLATGLREGKVMGLEWTWIDFDKRTLSFDGNRTKLGNTIPLNDTAMSVLYEIRAEKFRHMRRVFCYKGEPLDDYGAAWYKAMARAGLGTYTAWRDEKGKRRTHWEGDFHWHGFRHTFNTWLANAGVSKEIRRQLCGWSDGGGGSGDTADRYTHFEVDVLRPYSSIIDRALKGEQVRVRVA